MGTLVLRYGKREEDNVLCPLRIESNNNGGWAGPCYGCKHVDDAAPFECDLMPFDFVKIRRRCEDALRKTSDNGDILKVAISLNVKLI